MVRLVNHYREVSISLSLSLVPLSLFFNINFYEKLLKMYFINVDTWLCWCNRYDVLPQFLALPQHSFRSQYLSFETLCPKPIGNICQCRYESGISFILFCNHFIKAKREQMKLIIRLFTLCIGMFCNTNQKVLARNNEFILPFSIRKKCRHAKKNV